MAITIDQINQQIEATLSSMERKFCEGIAQGKGKRQAAVDAGYSETSAHVQAARNLKKDKIIQYIDRLRADTRRLTSESISKEVEKLDNVYKNAIDKKQYTAAVNAIRLKSQLLGFLVEKKEVQHSTLDTMNDDELTKYLDQIKSDHNINNWRRLAVAWGWRRTIDPPWSSALGDPYGSARIKYYIIKEKALSSLNTIRR